ncbi:MAG: hypothetical protein LBH64_00645 [Coriobacteriales bacterium]|jgi:flagellar basal body-associated protein FliL|nr:hypothetical protein [Coriobacteriales bacterium]
MSNGTNGSTGSPPVSEERIKKAKRTKVILIIIILLLVAALGVLTYLGYTVFQDGNASNQLGIKPTPTVTNNEVKDPSAPGEIKVEETSIPDLVSLFGLNIDEVKARLGKDFQLTKTDAATDEMNPAVKQLATFSYTPSISGDTTNMTANITLPSESIYISLDESGKVVDIYYVCDMRLLGYPEKSFDELLMSSELVTGALESAGVQPRDFSYMPPAPEESIVYDNPNSQNRKVVKQTQIFSGRTTSEAVPTAWTLTVTYDYGAGVTSTQEFREAARTINLRLA